MTNRHDEDLLAMAFNKHLDIYFPQTRGKLVYTHIANEGRSAQQGNKLKKMGVNAGWFDYLFISHPSQWKAICLEAKVHGRDYSDSQNKFDYMTAGMPVYKAKFYSVREGHQQLMNAGIEPLKPCRLFKEPSYLTFEDKKNLARNFFAP